MSKEEFLELVKRELQKVSPENRSKILWELLMEHSRISRDLTREEMEELHRWLEQD
jgi:uncharacterized membrane protein